MIDYSKIRKDIKLKGFTQKQIANELGLKQRHLNQILNEKSKMSAEIYIALCSVLGVHAEYYLKKTKQDSGHPARSVSII